MAELVEPVVRLEGATKRLGDRMVLEDVWMDVLPGGMIGLCGRNGSGKSMLLRVISGLVRLTTGTVTVFGKRVGRDVEFPADIGALIDQPGFLTQYSGRRNLELLAMIRNVVTREAIEATLRLVGLDPGDRRPVRTYSTGMRQRLGLAQALMERPRLLLLDEPTSALDRQGVEEVHELLKRLRDDGATTIITSHNQQELAELCDTVYEIERGRLIGRLW